MSYCSSLLPFASAVYQMPRKEIDRLRMNHRKSKENSVSINHCLYQPLSLSNSFFIQLCLYPPTKNEPHSSKENCLYQPLSLSNSFSIQLCLYPSRYVSNSFSLNCLSIQLCLLLTLSLFNSLFPTLFLSNSVSFQFFLLQTMALSYFINLFLKNIQANIPSDGATRDLRGDSGQVVMKVCCAKAKQFCLICFLCYVLLWVLFVFKETWNQRRQC